MKSSAFAPGHITGFFEPVYHNSDLARTGSRGAGINISFGVLTEVNIEQSNIQIFEIYVNKRKSTAPVTNLALKHLLENNNLHIIVKSKLDLPTGQGFGMSAAGALSTTLAASKIVGLKNDDAIRASHYADIQMKTGLGDVISSSFGGIEIRKSPGLPPWGIIEHIPGKLDIVICIIGKKIETKKVLSNPLISSKIIEYGKFCTKKILEKPTIENLFYYSQIFTNKTGIAGKKIIDAINQANNYGTASMCMLGNSVFASGETDNLCKILSSYGKVFVCSVDECGARILS